MQSAANYSYAGTTEKHSSQKDYTSGFGGKFGVQKDRQDKVEQQSSALSTALPHTSTHSNLCQIYSEMIPYLLME